MSSLHNQLKQTLKERQDLDSKDSHSASNTAIMEQLKAMEEEQSFVRQSLQTVYGDLLLLDLPAACNLHIDEKLWRNAIYPGIEDIRSKLRKLKNKDKAVRLEQQLASKIRHASRFYRKMNSSIKQEYHIDTATIGVHLFRNDSDMNDVELRTAKVLQHNYICMGDLERYSASIATKETPENPADRTSLAKQMYLKAIDIYRSNGKPYSQLALVSINSGSAIDIVWYYCMSMAMKEPATIALENLKSFYAKVRFSSAGSESSSSRNGDHRSTARKQISKAVEKFLAFQRELMFGNPSTDGDFPTLKSSMDGTESWDSLMEQAVRMVFLAVKSDQAQASSLLKLLRSTLMRMTVILIITIWYLGHQQVSHRGQEEQFSAQATQRMALLHGCLLHTNINIAIQDTILSQDHLDENVVRDAQKAIVTATSIWATFLTTNMHTLTSCCAGASSLRRQPHGRAAANDEADKLISALSKLLSAVMSLKPFTPVTDRPLPATFPLAEDYTLLGLAPLETFHKSVDFLKETKRNAPTATDARTEVRWYRIYDLCQRLVESGAFSFISFDIKDQRYTVYDKESRKQQQTRLMKALATQRLMDQVSTLENSLGKMTTAAESSSPKRPARTRQGPLRVFTVVLDVTAFLDGLVCVRRWAGQGSDSATQYRGFICEVIVPLDTIDSLDEHKKGTSHANAQARESIRYLDNKLERSSGGSMPTAVNAKESFLRTQRVTERLSSWDDAQFYWLGEQQQANAHAREHEDDEEEVLLSPSESDSDENGDSLLHSRFRRRGDSDSDDEFDTESEDESEASEPEVTYADVPKRYRSIISCLLYYHSHRPTTDTSTEPSLVLATNDQDLAWWVSHFGDPETGTRLASRRVDEWDRVVRSKAYL